MFSVEFLAGCELRVEGAFDCPGVQVGAGAVWATDVSRMHGVRVCLFVTEYLLDTCAFTKARSDEAIL